MHYRYFNQDDGEITVAEAGCSDREIMAILGHRTAAMVIKYTRGAEQKRLAKAAIVKLESRTKVSNTPAKSVKHGGKGEQKIR